MPLFYGIDTTYILMVLPCIILSLWANASVKSTFNKYSKQISGRRITGADAARQVLIANGVTDVRIDCIGGQLTDHYDPQANVIRLSNEVYHSASTAAIGVACHEAGHAVQYAKNYGPVKIRAAIVPVTNIGSHLAIPLILLGILLTTVSELSTLFVYTGIFCFALTFIFQLVTLPVEFNASRRAMIAIEQSNILTQDEQKGAKRTLRAAAMTYIAATALAFVQLLRLILQFSNRGKRRK